MIANPRGRPIPKTDHRDTPAYGLAEAARYVDLASATLRSWVFGREYPRRGGKGVFRPLIEIADRDQSLLSFNNLIEAHVLRALRTEHGVSIKDVRSAVKYAERSLSIERLLLRPELRTHAGELLIERYGQLISLSRSGQLAMKMLLQSYLKRIEWDTSHIPRRLYPFVRTVSAEAPRLIVIDPLIAFGRPVVVSRGITTAVIRDRIDGGESVDAVSRDYELDRTEVEQAVVYERAA
ncbi:MAG TPA: DUF433 domain-containing protein [Gemmatimonadaceae bacterium]|nr:DUF433 domain-containing protein [Gemmatimonadaceae bacterium]